MNLTLTLLAVDVARFLLEMLFEGTNYSHVKAWKEFLATVCVHNFIYIQSPMMSKRVLKN